MERERVGVQRIVREIKMEKRKEEEGKEGERGRGGEREGGSPFLCQSLLSLCLS